MSGTQSSPRRATGRVVRVSVAVAALAILAIAPGAHAQSAAPVGGLLFIDADTVLGPTNLTEEERATKTCVQASRFAHNEEVVWRVKVFDPLTGQPLDDTMLSSVEVRLPTETLSLHYGGHPRDTPVDFFWTVGWDVPEGYPTGAVAYTIDAIASDGRTGTWEQFGVTLAQLTITEEVRPIIEE
jgi:hypothetical protein